MASYEKQPCPLCLSHCWMDFSGTYSNVSSMRHLGRLGPLVHIPVRVDRRNKTPACRGLQSSRSYLVQQLMRDLVSSSLGKSCYITRSFLPSMPPCIHPACCSEPCSLEPHCSDGVREAWPALSPSFSRPRSQLSSSSATLSSLSVPLHILPSDHTDVKTMGKEKTNSPSAVLPGPLLCSQALCCAPRPSVVLPGPRP